MYNYPKIILAISQFLIFTPLCRQIGAFMRFRPCIDIHNGSVKQIIGSSLNDAGDLASENFISEYDAGHYARLYRQYNLPGGHIIILNPSSSPYYEADVTQALRALKEFPGGLQVGGGITGDNALFFLNHGASHIIVTSYVFSNGKADFNRLKALSELVGKKRLVLDLSCRKKNNAYYIVTDRWQKFTDLVLTHETLDSFAPYCDEFLIHAVDVEGKASGIEFPLVCLLADWNGLNVTYAGGIASYGDIEALKSFGKARLDFTIGSSLDLFGGNIPFKDLTAL